MSYQVRDVDIEDLGAVGNLHSYVSISDWVTTLASSVDTVGGMNVVTQGQEVYLQVFQMKK